MSAPALRPDEVTRVGIVGTGAIGASWAAFWLARGTDVLAYDPAPGSAERLRDELAPLLSGSARPGALAAADSVEAVARDSHLVLECGPERLDVKRDVFARLDASAPPEVLLTSSSSGLMPSTFQDACRHHPERVLIAHPFNPPHLVPLVEIVGGRGTSPAAIDAAMALFSAVGKRPIHVAHEVPGHVANRLQAALWREAYSLVDRGVCSVSDIDAAISSGPGLRWALLGPFATQHLSGGPGGLAHVLDHLGPPMAEWWEDLGDPQLTPALKERLVAGVEEELPVSDLAALARRRDAALTELLALKAGHRLEEGIDRV